MKSADHEVEVMTRAVVAWGHKRWPDCRAIRELVLGGRRIDVLFVMPADIVGVEIKSSDDKLDRLEAQMIEYSRYVPEVWLAVAPKWQEPVERMYRVPNAMIVNGAAVHTIGEYSTGLGKPGKKPYRDELSIMRLIELLWRDEAATIAERTGVVPGARHTQMRNGKLYPMLARLLTGSEILREVARELRSRPLAMVGRGSDGPVAAPTGVSRARGNPVAPGA